jgi:5-(carboxyamino)imidazole ribonucleotide synthase
MLALAGYPLGLEFVVLDPTADACASPVAEHTCGSFDDQSLLDWLADRVDLVTYEFENVPAETVRLLAERVPVYPPLAALAASQDRLREKTLFRDLDIPVASFVAVDGLAALEYAVAEIGLPAVLKTRTLGYDGKGQARLLRKEDLAPAWESLGSSNAIVEAYVPYDRELSIIAARGRDGQIVHYPLSENVHRDGILRQSVARPGDSMQGLAEDYVSRLLNALDYVGVVALELFQVGNQLLANEFAPRVHNSGHWTIEGAETSQFENHLRAVCGLPLGDTNTLGHAAMLNIIGEVPDTIAVLEQPGAHLHLYGKESRRGRKLGHITVRARDDAALKQALDVLRPRTEGK